MIPMHIFIHSILLLLALLFCCACVIVAAKGNRTAPSILCALLICIVAIFWFVGLKTGAKYLYYEMFERPSPFMERNTKKANELYDSLKKEGVFKHLEESEDSI